MVKICCALVGAGGSGFSVRVDEGDSVEDLKQAIKAVKPRAITCDADELQLYLAKKNGAWLTEREAQEMTTTTGLPHLQFFQAEISDVGLSEEDVRHQVDKRQVALGNGPINVLVVVPTETPQPPFFWRQPKPLVSSTGVSWDFQNSLDLRRLASNISRHYQAWREGKQDKRNHPLFVCLDGPGTGKSRLLDEFPSVLQQQLFRDETHEDPGMKRLLQTAYTFKITFENETADNHGISDPRKMIGTRMLYQLQDSLDWTRFNANPVNQVMPGDVLQKLSAITGTETGNMCVVLCVDGLQKLQHEPGNKHSEFYSAFSSLCSLVNGSKFWIIVICAATVYQPVDEFLASSPQWRVMLQTTPLTRPKVKGVDVFDAFNDGKQALVQLLVDDMGGHGRALEELLRVLLDYQGRDFEFVPVIHDVLFAIREAYPAIVTQMKSMKQAFLAVISRRTVDDDSRFGTLSLDQVISSGLIRRDGTHLRCPFLLYMLLKTRKMPWDRLATFAPAEKLEDLKPWQAWEEFNCKFRVLKSRAFAQGTPVSWTDIHDGARFGAGCNRQVIQRKLTHTLALNRMPTKTLGFATGRCSCGNDRGHNFLYQPASGSPSGDAFLCLEDATQGFFHEVHQCKCVEEAITLDVFLREREKAAGPEDLFIMYCTSQVTADLSLLPPNSAIVDVTCWKEYYGPFAARAFFIKCIPPPCINSSSKVQLGYVRGVGAAYRDRIAAKRPFTSLEDAADKTDIPDKVIKRFTFRPSSM